MQTPMMDRILKLRYQGPSAKSVMMPIQSAPRTDGELWGGAQQSTSTTTMGFHWGNISSTTQGTDLSYSGCGAGAGKT